MLRFQQGNHCLNFRAVAVILHENHVLVHKSQKDDFWALPGGRVEFFEFSQDTIAREIEEELGIHCTVDRLLWYVENFFHHESKIFHEVSTFFLTKLEEGSLDCFERPIIGIEPDQNLIFQWAKLVDLPHMELYPLFLKDKLRNLPKSTEYIKVDEINI